jgi:exopolysaccharide biosynthesis polyprenyl glycosylphosphotransferase
MTLALVLVTADAVLTAAVFLGVSVARFESDPRAVWSVGISPEAGSFLFAAAWLFVSWLLGLYRLRVRWSLLAEARDILRASAVLLALTLSLLFLLHQDDVSRVFLVLLFLVQPMAAILLRALLRTWFDSRGREGRNSTQMLIVGTGPMAEAFADAVEAHSTLGIRVLGHIAVPAVKDLAGDRGALRHVDDAETHLLSRPVLGSVEQMDGVFRTTVVDEVAVCTPAGSSGYLESIVAIAADYGKTVRVPRDLEEGVLRGALSEEFGGFLVRSIVTDGQREANRAMKRMFDIVGALVAIVVLSPIWVSTAVAIWIADGRPILFRQVRVGLHGRSFTIYKFRTMVADAEERFHEVARLSETQGAAFKMTNDPRVTGIGRVVRAWALDELPQLINVLAGDMSLVGPRPAPQREVDAYDIWHRRRLCVRPGMTGLWQVEARFDQHFDDRAALDLRYIEQWSLWLDFCILLRTVPAVLSAKGR